MILGILAVTSTLERGKDVTSQTSSWVLLGDLGSVVFHELELQSNSHLNRSDPLRLQS